MNGGSFVPRLAELPLIVESDDVEVGLAAA
jgi:hypothetical protein